MAHKLVIFRDLEQLSVQDRV